MNELNIKISDAVTEVEVILERIYVLSNDLDQGYFEQDIKKKDDMWRIAGSYYEHAGVKTNMILNMANDVQNKLREIQEMLQKNSIMIIRASIRNGRCSFYTNF